MLLAQEKIVRPDRSSSTAVCSFPLFSIQHLKARPLLHIRYGNFQLFTPTGIQWWPKISESCKSGLRTVAATPLITDHQSPITAATCSLVAE